MVVNSLCCNANFVIILLLIINTYKAVYVLYSLIYLFKPGRGRKLQDETGQGLLVSADILHTGHASSLNCFPEEPLHKLWCILCPRGKAKKVLNSVPASPRPFVRGCCYYARLLVSWVTASNNMPLTLRITRQCMEQENMRNTLQYRKQNKHASYTMCVSQACNLLVGISISATHTILMTRMHKIPHPAHARHKDEYAK